MSFIHNSRAAASIRTEFIPAEGSFTEQAIAFGHIRSFSNRPLLVNPSYLPMLSAAVDRYTQAILTPEVIENTIAANAANKMAGQNFIGAPDGLAIIPVYGFLTYRAAYGYTSYEAIRAQFQNALADPTVKNIVFNINSPGGEVAGAFDIVDEIYQARGQKPIYAVFNEEGFSAAFAIASAADKRYISRTGATGSVGIVSMHVDQSGMDAQRGLAYTYIYAGGHKVDYSSHGPLAPEALALAQEDINATYDLFVNTVARNLGMTPATVRATEASIYQGKKAVDVGFADAVMSWNQFMTKLTNRKYGGIMKAELENLWKEMAVKFMALVGGNGNPDAPEVRDVVTKADAENLIAAAEASARAEGREAGHAAGVSEAKTRAVEILAVCKLAGLEAMAYDLVSGDLSVAEAGIKIQEARAVEAERNRVTSTVDPLKTGTENPLMTDAMKRLGTT